MRFNSEIYGKVYHPQAEPMRKADGFIKKPEKTEPKQDPEPMQDPEPKQDPEPMQDPGPKQDPEPMQDPEPKQDPDGTGGD